jgi:hypothetical protein
MADFIAIVPTETVLVSHCFLYEIKIWVRSANFRGIQL